MLVRRFVELGICFVFHLASFCGRFVMFSFVHQVQVGRLKDQVQKLNDEKEDFQLRESKLTQENARYTLLFLAYWAEILSPKNFILEMFCTSRSLVTLTMCRI